MRVAIVESDTPAPVIQEWDSRVYTISPASVRSLEQTGVWRRVDPSRTCPVHRMRIFGDDGKSAIGFSAYESGMSELAHVAEFSRLQQASHQELNERDDVVRYCPDRPSRLTVSPSHAQLTLESGAAIRARLVVGADGSNSWVRQTAGLPVEDVPYGQQGVVANFAAEHAHDNTAYQWFLPGGILAWLPLPGNRISMVWSAKDDHATVLLGLPRHEFEETVANAGGRLLGQLTCVTAPVAFPLHRLLAHRLVGARVALIGDAAHVVHPLAGQGINLGFADAVELSATLCGAGPGVDAGNPMLLRRYERARAEDILAMDWATRGLNSLFGARDGLIRVARNQGLSLTDRLPVLKTLLTRYAVGKR